MNAIADQGAWGGPRQAARLLGVAIVLTQVLNVVALDPAARTLSGFVQLHVEHPSLWLPYVFPWVLYFLVSGGDDELSETSSARKIERLVESNRRLQGALEAVVDGVILVDALDQIVHVDERASELLDVDARTAVGRPVAEVLQRPLTGGSLELRTRRGSTVYLDVYKRLFDGDSAHCVYLLRDVGRQRESERSLTDRAKEAELVASLTRQFLVQLTQEFGSAVTAAALLSQFTAESATGVDDDVHTDLQEIARETGQLAQTLRHARDVLRIDRVEGSLVLEPFDLVACVDESLARIRQTRDVALDRGGLSSPSMVQADRPRTMDVLELLVDAAHRMLANPTLTFRLAPLRSGERSAVVELHCSGTPTAEIGAALDAMGHPRLASDSTDDLVAASRIMERGLGLHLPAARRYARDMAGDLSASRREDGGFVLRFTLPVASASARDSTDDRAWDVLVLDAEGDLLDAMRRAEPTRRCHATTDAFDAIHVAARERPIASLVVFGTARPIEWQFLALLKTHRGLRGLPVVLASFDRGLQTGCVLPFREVIAKPLQVNPLVTHLAGMKARRGVASGVLVCSNDPVVEGVLGRDRTLAGWVVTHASGAAEAERIIAIQRPAVCIVDLAIERPEVLDTIVRLSRPGSTNAYDVWALAPQESDQRDVARASQNLRTWRLGEGVPAAECARHAWAVLSEVARTSPGTERDEVPTLTGSST